MINPNHFRPTVNLWNPTIQRAIACGDLVLRRGQWVQCGSGPKSRYVGMSDRGVLDVVHYPNTGKHFNLRAAFSRISEDTTLTTKQKRAAVEAVRAKFN